MMYGSRRESDYEIAKGGWIGGEVGGRLWIE